MSDTNPIAPHTIRPDRGSVIPIVGLLLPVLILMTAFAVDLGAQRSSRRTMQARADVIALDMVRLADGRTTDQIWNHSTTRARLVESATNNDIELARIDDVIVEVVWGEYDATVQPLPFVPHHVHGVAPADNTLVPDAVLITTTETTDYRFRPGSGTVTRTAIASLGDEPQAEFLLGSTLVSVTPPSNWIIGRTLQRVIPGAELVGYNGLANTSVTLRSLAVGLGLGSPTELVDATVTFRQLLDATVTALEAEDSSSPDEEEAIAVMNNVRSLSFEDFDVPIGQVLGLGTLGTTNPSGLEGSVSVPQMLFFGVQVANGVDAITIPNSVVNVAGLAGITLDLSAVEPPKRIGTEDLADDTTSQVDVGVTISVDITSNQNQKPCDLPSDEQALLANLLGLLWNCVLFPNGTEPLDVSIQGDIGLDLTLGEVYAQQSIDCSGPVLNIGYDTNPGTAIVTSDLAVDVLFSGSTLTLLGITAPSVTAPIDGTTGSVAFQPTDVGPRHTAFEQVFADGSTAGPTVRVGSPNLGLTSLVPSSGLQVTVVNEDLPVLGGIASNLVVPTLNNLLDEVDRQVVAEISKLLGANLGGADITPQFMECEDNSVRLVG